MVDVARSEIKRRVARRARAALVQLHTILCDVGAAPGSRVTRRATCGEGAFDEELVEYPGGIHKLSAQLLQFFMRRRGGGLGAYPWTLVENREAVLETLSTSPDMVSTLLQNCVPGGQ